jgi:hypothetical protein
MNEVNIPDPWANKRELSIDDGSSFAGGYDTNKLTISIPGGFQINAPEYVGYWQISGDFRINVIKRPNRLNRFMTRLLLGWIWVDG